MRLILLLLLLVFWIQNQLFSSAAQPLATTTITTPPSPVEAIDVQDGHPNHRLWQKMIDTGRVPPNDW